MKSAVIVLALGLALGCSKDKGSGDGTGGGGGGGGGLGSAAQTATGSDTAGAGSDAGSGSGSGSAQTPGAPAWGAEGWDFDKLSYEEQRAFMKEHVVPTMKPLFQKFDPSKYASFGCKTCHGKDPQAVKYKMPSADLPKLDFKALEAGKQKPEIAKWMSETVKPEMAKLLRQTEMTKDNPTGFGCLGCHEEKK